MLLYRYIIPMNIRKVITAMLTFLLSRVRIAIMVKYEMKKRNKPFNKSVNIFLNTSLSWNASLTHSQINTNLFFNILLLLIEVMFCYITIYYFKNEEKQNYGFQIHLCIFVNDFYHSNNRYTQNEYQDPLKKVGQYLLSLHPESSQVHLD